MPSHFQWAAVLPWRGAARPSRLKPGADEMVLGEKMFEVFVGRSYIDHD